MKICHHHNAVSGYGSVVAHVGGGSPLFVGMASPWQLATPAMGVLGRDRHLNLILIETRGTILCRTA